MDRRNLIIVDSPDTGDVTPVDVYSLVEHLRNEHPDAEVHAAWEEQSAAHIGDYWPEIILWVTGDGGFLADTLRAYVIYKVLDPLLSRMGKVCVKLTRSTGENTGKVFRRVYLERGKDPVDEELSEDEQEPVTKSPIRE